MTHAPRRDELSDLALGLLEPEQARALEAHAATCPGCGAELAALRRTRQLVAGLPPPEAPARGLAPVLEAARREAERAAASRSWRWATPGWRWGGTLGLAGAAAVALLVLRVTPPPATPPAGEREGAPVAPVASGALEKRTEPLADASPTRPEAPAPAAAPAPARARRVEKADALAGAPPAPLAAGRSPAPLAPRAAEAEAPVAAAGAGGAGLAAEEKAEWSARRASLAAAPASVQRAAPVSAKAVAAASSGAGLPPCGLEQRRHLTRDAAGVLLGRVREGQYPAAGGPVTLRVEERFGPDGRLRGATVTAGDRRFTVGEQEIEAGRLEPLPGAVLAGTAAEAERAPPPCQP